MGYDDKDNLSPASCLPVVLGQDASLRVPSPTCDAPPVCNIIHKITRLLLRLRVAYWLHVTEMSFEQNADSGNDGMISSILWHHFNYQSLTYYVDFLRIIPYPQFIKPS
jgi:hypothetical protein